MAERFTYAPQMGITLIEFETQYKIVGYVDIPSPRDVAAEPIWQTAHDIDII